VISSKAVSGQCAGGRYFSGTDVVHFQVGDQPDDSGHIPVTGHFRAGRAPAGCGGADQRHESRVISEVL